MAKRSKDNKALHREAPAPQKRFPFGPGWIPGLALAVAIIIAYSPVWWAGYIWDDDINVTANPCIIGPLGLREIWTTNAAQFYPLTLTTFWVEHALWGLQPLPWHLVNVFMHAACAVVLWRVLRRLAIPGAWLGAALWALHPVQVETVAWITELKNTQSGLFYLLAILFFVKGLTSPDSANPRGWNWDYALTLIFSAMAIASKSSTVILPLVLCLCAWWIERKWNWRNLVKVAPIIPFSIASCALTIWTQVLAPVRATTPYPVSVHGWQGTLAAGGDAFWFYLGKVIWPYPWMARYPEWKIDAGNPLSYLPLLAVILLLVVLGLKCNSWGRPWFFAFAYFLVVILPMLLFADKYIGDHFLYLACIGPLALVAAGMARLGNAILAARPVPLAAIPGTLLLVLGVWSWNRAWVFENDEILWTETLLHNPACLVGYLNLGVHSAARGRLDEAILYCRKALDLDPGYTAARNNLGVFLSDNGQVDEAIAQFQTALQAAPRDVDARKNLGDAYAKKGQVDEAMNEYRKTLEIDPNNSQAHLGLGLAYGRLKQMDNAAAEFRKMLEINPGDAVAHNNLGSALLLSGHVDEAVAQFQEAVRLMPGYGEAQRNLAIASQNLLQKPALK